MRRENKILYNVKFRHFVVHNCNRLTTSLNTCYRDMIIAFMFYYFPYIEI